MSYANRRYQVVDGRLRRRYDRRDDPAWFMTKPEALAADEVLQREKAAAAKTRVARLAKEKLAKESRAAKEAASVAWEAKGEKIVFDGEVVEEAGVDEPSPPTVPPTPTPETETADYETWKGPALRSEIKARTGKGPKVGAESTKVAMIERLRGLDDAKDVLRMVAPQAVAEAEAEADLAAAAAEGDVVV